MYHDTIPCQAPTVPAPPLRDNELYDGRFADGSTEVFLWTEYGAITMKGLKPRNDLVGWEEILNVDVLEES